MPAQETAGESSKEAGWQIRGVAGRHSVGRCTGHLLVVAGAETGEAGRTELLCAWRTFLSLDLEGHEEAIEGF